MRVIAGTAKSLPLKGPEGQTRPTTDRIKETLFNMLQPYTQGSVFVDIFSGSGAIGIEALSRGAKKAYFIDSAITSTNCIQDNLQFTKLTENSIILKQDAVSALGNIYETEVDIIFIDPPYNQGLEKQVLKALAGYPYIKEHTILIVESDLKTDFSYVESLGFTITKEKKYKTNKHLFLEKVK